MRRFLPTIVGLVLGALVVSVLMNIDIGRQERATEPEALQRTGLPAPIERQEPRIDDPPERRIAALALATDAAFDPATIDQIAATLPANEAILFRIHAIVEQGARDLPGAMAAVQALPEYEQRRLALLHLATALAMSDPAGAIAASTLIATPDLRTDFVTGLFDAWAETDPAGLLSYLESGNSTSISPGDAALDLLAASDAERLLDIAGSLRRDIAMRATARAMQALIEIDAGAVLALIETLPPGAGTSNIEARAIEIYGSQDPEAAWAWATEKQASALVRISIIRGIHQVDPDFAWENMQETWNSPDLAVRKNAQLYLLNYVNAVVNSKTNEEITTGLDRILSLEGDDIASRLSTNLQLWGESDPEAALSWTLRNVDRINADSVLPALSGGLTRIDLDRARETLLNLDDAHQAAWSTGVARELAQTDLAAARAWSFELASGPARDAGLREVVHGLAQQGSVEPQLFEMFSSDTSRSEAANLAARRLHCIGESERALELATSYITEQRLLDRIRSDIEGNANPLNGFLGCRMLQ